MPRTRLDQETLALPADRPIPAVVSAPQLVALLPLSGRQDRRASVGSFREMLETIRQLSTRTFEGVDAGIEDCPGFEPRRVASRL